jgi:hypothetical protein
MSSFTRIVTLALIISVSATRARADEASTPASAPDPAPVKQWVWLESQGVWGYGYQIQEGPNKGYWKIDPGTKTPPMLADPYGFAAVLNQVRASVGLPPAVYDAELSQWAAQNNVAQSSRGLGHHINPNCFQNCGWNYPSAESVAIGWMNSPGHRQNMLLPGMTRFGIAYGPGPYWTMNAM